MHQDESIPPVLVNLFRKNQDGSFSIVDMATNEPAAEGIVPAFITASEYYSTGIKKLKKHAREVDISIWFGRHDKQNDFGDLETIKQALQETDLYIPEGTGWTRDELPIWDEVSTGDKPYTERQVDKVLDALGITAENRHAYRRTLIKAVRGSRVRVRYVDLAFYDLKELDGLKDLVYTRRAYKEQRKAQYFGRNYFYWFSTYNFYREWIMVAKLGHEIDSFIADKSRKSSGKMKVLMTIGSVHYGLVAKLTMFGVDPQFSYPRESDTGIKTTQSIAKIANQYRYTPSDISLYRGLSEMKLDNKVDILPVK